MTDEPLDMLRVMSLVTDTLADVMLQRDSSDAAHDLIARRRPSVRELAAARRENLELHGGGTPDLLKELGCPPRPIPLDLFKLRRLIDKQLAIATRVLDPN